MLSGSLTHFAFLHSSVIFAMVVTLIVILFVALIFNMCRKLTCIIGIFINFLIHFLLFFLCIIFRVYHFLTFGCFFPLAILLLLCIFVNILHVSCLFFTNSNDYNSSSGSVIFRVHNVRS